MYLQFVTISLKPFYNKSLQSFAIEIDCFQICRKIFRIVKNFTKAALLFHCRSAVPACELSRAVRTRMLITLTVKKKKRRDQRIKVIVNLSKNGPLLNNSLAKRPQFDTKRSKQVCLRDMQI